jgi:transcriptional regulator with GAF, ATPase, and Fis domain
MINLSNTWMFQAFDLFSNVLGCHLDLVDCSRVRIGSSSFIRSRFGLGPEEGRITSLVLEKGQVLVTDRRASQLPEPCADCPLHAHCDIKFEIAAPVIKGDRIRGVLVAIAFNEQEAEQIALHREEFEWLTQYIATQIEFLSPDFVCSDLSCDRFDTWKAYYEPINRQTDNLTLDDLFPGIWGISPQIRQAKEEACKIATTSDNVLIVGETGTGKELFGQAIHYLSSRKDGPFIAVNCASIPDSLLESELFGYGPGSFTGAERQGKKGKIELAHEGTLFLDEIGEMSPFLQAKLLRFLENRQIEKIGAVVERPVDVRIITATNQPLEALVKGDVLRPDIFHRISAHCLALPPLRDREGDIEFLASRFLSLKGYSFPDLEDEVRKALLDYTWPGNVRELKNCIVHAACMAAEKMIELKHLPIWIRDHYKNPEQITHASTVNLTYNGEIDLRTVEKKAILLALNRFGWCGKGKRLAAEALNIDLSTLYRKIKKYNLDKFRR